MKNFSIVIFVAISGLVLSVNAKIPNYIKTCGRNDPEISKCIKNTVNQLRPKLSEGIPELSVPSIKNLTFDRVDLELGPGFKAEIRNLVLDGFENFIFNDVQVDLAAGKFAFNISIPSLEAHGTYEIDAAIGSIPLRGLGPFYFAPKSITGHGTLYGKKLLKNTKTLFYFPSMDLKLIINDYYIRLDNLFDGDPTIGPVTNKLLNEEKTEVLASILPGVERAVTLKVLLIGNNICKHFTWEELFPEK